MHPILSSDGRDRDCRRVGASGTPQPIKERHPRERAGGPRVEADHAQSAVLLESFPRACLTLDDEWQLIHLNHQAWRLLQTPHSRQGREDAIIGMKLREAFPPVLTSLFV